MDQVLIWIALISPIGGNVLAFENIIINHFHFFLFSKIHAPHPPTGGAGRFDFMIKCLNDYMII